MGDYVKKNSNKPAKRVIIERRIEQPTIDISQLANAVAKTIIANLPKTEQNGQPNMPNMAGMSPNGSSVKDDNFDASVSLERLAESMIVQRGNKSSNFNDLGKIRETDKDNAETDKTIDLLKGLED